MQRVKRQLQGVCRRRKGYHEEDTDHKRSGWKETGAVWI